MDQAVNAYAMLYAVHADKLIDVWPSIEGYVEKALEHTDVLTSDDVFDAISDKRMQCFVVGKPIIGVVVTEIAPYPQKTILRVVVLAIS